MRREGWTYEGMDASAHTIWSHPKASGTYLLPETPRRFDVQRSRREVQKLMGEQPAGKRRPKEMRAVAAPAPRPAVVTRSAPPQRRKPARLPWEGQPDNYDRGLARLMSTPPGSH
jgi:hypothetical protein